MSDLFPAVIETEKAIAEADQFPMRGDPLVRLAIEKDFDAEKLDKIITLFNKQEDRRIREDFETVFAEMRSKLPTIRKESQGHNNKYASLEAIQKACNPVIQNYGFSYRWREEAIEGSAAKRVVLTITRRGYSIENYFDVPQLPTNGSTNAVQAAGAMSSYGKRYTFIAGFGLTIEGEDADGTYTLEDLDKAEGYLKPIREAKTREQLQTAFSAAWMTNKGNDRMQRLIAAAKDKRKGELDARA